MKTCRACHEEKPFTEFYRRKDSRDGYQYECKSCHNVRLKAWYVDHREEAKARTKGWNAEHPEIRRAVMRSYREEHKEASRVYDREYKGTHQERGKLLASLWYAKHKEENNASCRRWKQDHPDRVRESNRKRRTLKMGAVGGHTQQGWDLLKARYGFTCPRCHRTEPDISLTEDHIVPLSQGGMDSIDNIQPLCRRCNSAKSTQTIRYESREGEL